ncbi:SARP family transcriptional regulator [Streptomyces radicis]|uniref:SARP family transcriptional regulator n=2 Tax=Streptomyces radicis TaxID=1750517 RepID=A0A3A9VVG2_9ACTN|nr:SARP family transcriptional regulator [Streptomyces radicis]RKN15500.1 SARP family transcriptional regulator [Streptomyces radicis]
MKIVGTEFPGSPQEVPVPPAGIEMTRDRLSFRVLGPIEVRRGGAVVRLSGRKVRSVLAALLLRADRVVPAEHLVAVLWGEDPPPTAMSQVHKYVSQLRARLGHDRIARRGGGYLLPLRQHESDLAEFDRLTAAARSALAAGRRAEAVRILGTALALWRGRPLADGTDELVRSEAPALEERRVDAFLRKAEAELALGRCAELVGELRTFVAEHPLSEQLRALLMLALYRSGRVAEALSTYREGRELLADELGLDPGPDLRRLHEAILTREPWLDVHDGAPEPRRAAPPTSQLPAGIADFTGRAAQLTRIGDVLTTGQGDAPPLLVVSGMPGVGKSTLAVHAARHVAEAFPDGHLYARLRDDEGGPVAPLAVLRRFLRALDVPDDAVPDDAVECGDLFRAGCAGRRLLIVLDDAVDEAQVRPLLPSHSGNATLVTSRRRLAGLEAAHHLTLDAFDADDAVVFFERAMPAGQRADRHGAIREITALCGRLPLALRIAAARFAQQTSGDLMRFTRRLAEERRRLDVLQAGDLGVRATLATGYRDLAPRERRTFALLGLVRAPDFASWVAAPLLDVDPGEAEERVERLVDAHLIAIAGWDHAGHPRYRHHPLARLYARERAEAELPAAERRSAVLRALEAWLALATEAGARLHGAARGTRFAADPHELIDAPLAWFHTERAALSAAVDHAWDEGHEGLAMSLAASIGDLLRPPRLGEGAAAVPVAVGAPSGAFDETLCHLLRDAEGHRGV